MNNSIADIEKALGIVLPGAYRNFLLQEQLTGERMVTGLVLLYGTDMLVTFNTMYEVQRYLPAYITIGDDSGGRAICLHCNDSDENVYITGHGALDTGSMEVLSTDFNTWVQQGYSLDIIREAPDTVAFHATETWQLRAAWQALHLAVKELEVKKTTGMDLKTYLTQKRVLQQQIKDFEVLHAGKKYRV
jgi:hypothetical protein